MLPVTNSNLQLDDVVGVFGRIEAKYSYRKYFKCGAYPTSLLGIGWSHFKGISVYDGKFIFTYTDLDIDAVNGKFIVADDFATVGQGQTEGTFATLHPHWSHPCSSQACGSFMAMGIQKSAEGPDSNVSEIQIIDIRTVGENFAPVLIGAIDRPNNGVNGVGFTKEEGIYGKYIIAALNGTSLTIYKSGSESLYAPAGEPTATFSKIFQIEDFSESGAGLGLITEKGGKIFMLTMNADSDGANSKICLFEIVANAPVTVTKVAELALPITDMSNSVINLQNILKTVPELEVIFKDLGEPVLNSSFRWGKGLAITSTDSIEIYASDRNVLPLNSDQDFSVIAWKSIP